MPTDRGNDPNPPPDFALDDSLARWEAEDEGGDEREEDLRAIREGLADVETGRTSDAFEFLERMRRKVRSLTPP